MFIYISQDERGIKCSYIPGENTNKFLNLHVYCLKIIPKVRFSVKDIVFSSCANCIIMTISFYRVITKYPNISSIKIQK
jgi:hypothetical protein